MTIEDDTEWLREQLGQESFHHEHSQKWVAVRDRKVVFTAGDRTVMQSWLDLNDSNDQCILAFGDERIIR